MDPTASSRAKKDDGLDPISRFATKGLDILDTHHSDIEVLKTKVDAIEQRDRECREAQATSWRRFGERMEALETSLHGDVRNLTSAVENHIQSDERSMKREENRRGDSVKVWVAIITMLGVLASSTLSAIMAYKATLASATVEAAVNAMIPK